MLRSDSWTDRISLAFRWSVFLFCGCLAAITDAQADEPASEEGTSSRATIDFSSQIRPILAEHCLTCHGPDENERQAGLRLDLDAIDDHGGIVRGDPESSPLIDRVVTDDPDLVMPPPDSGERLSDDQIALLREWIRQGAAYDLHWAYRPIAMPEMPPPDPAELTVIDRFVLRRLRERGLEFAPEISRRQWLRRATFDLTGLPPSWDEVQSFLADDSADAYEQVVDRLLATPAYGERWGRFWLDIARYADTHGGSAIGFTQFPFSYTYRDYVVDAFNRDLPYDRFVIEQLAADQLGLPENDPSLAALGFLTVGMQYRNPHDVIDDQIDVISRGLMGLTVACARCHDHKYDAIPTEDYYSLYATLVTSETPVSLPVIGQPEVTAESQAYSDQLHRLDRLQEDMRRDQSALVRARLRMQVGRYLREIAAGAVEQDLASVFLSYRTDDLRPLVLNRWIEYLQTMPDTDPVFGPWGQLRQLDAENFEEAAEPLLTQWAKDNEASPGDAGPHALGGTPPRWNPRVLEQLRQQPLTDFNAVADAYGRLFAEVQREWMTGLVEAAMEAHPDGEIVPDEDPRHAPINAVVNQQLRHHLHAPGTPTALDDLQAAELLNRPIRDTLSGRGGAIHGLHLSSPASPPRAMVLEESDQRSSHFVFLRGDPMLRGQPVRPRFLKVLSDGSRPAFEPGQRRLDLAREIVDDDNPLTRRVIVNWVWRHHFGRGLVRTPDDLGTRGDPPTHPELLDYLATVFADDGWSLKRLHRRILLSAVYRQGAIERAAARVVDPDNHLLWRMPRRHLDMEAMRDALLATSGELDRSTLGGRPFQLFSDPVVPRRSLYAMVNRDIVSDFASTFDAADPNACTAKRPETMVPQQTLFALNSDFIQDRAAQLATQPELQSAESDSEYVRRLYQRVYGRNPQSDEMELAIAFLTPAAAADQASLRQQLAHVLLAANEFVFVD